MKIVVINLARAEARRKRMEEQFAALGLEAGFHEAVDGRRLTQEHYGQVDRETRRRRGLKPQPDGSIANWLSQTRVMRELVENGPEVLTILEDDAVLAAELPEVLGALERRPFAYDIVKLNRRTPRKKFVRSMQLSTGHYAGRVRFHDFGCEGYVITREAARHFLERFPRMTWEIDQAVSYFWENGLNVFYVDPPVVLHAGGDDSEIEGDRKQARDRHRKEENQALVLCRSIMVRVGMEVLRRRAYRRLLRGEIGVSG